MEFSILGRNTGKTTNLAADGQVSFEWMGLDGTFQLQRKGSINEDWEYVGVPVSEKKTTAVRAEGTRGSYRLVEIETSVTP